MLLCGSEDVGRRYGEESLRVHGKRAVVGWGQGSMRVGHTWRESEGGAEQGVQGAASWGSCSPQRLDGFCRSADRNIPVKRSNSAWLLPQLGSPPRTQPHWAPPACPETQRCSRSGPSRPLGEVFQTQ